MKTLISILIAGTITAAAGPGPARSDGATKSAEQTESAPPFKTVVIHYKTRSYIRDEHGTIFHERKGVGTKYLDIAGNRRRDEVSVIIKERSGSVRKSGFVQVFDGKTFYMTGSGRPPFFIDLSNRHPVAWADAQFSNKTLLRGEEIFLNQRCRVYRDPEMREWSWYGILLKHQILPQVHFQPYELEEALSLDLNVELDPSLFSPGRAISFKPYVPSPGDLFLNLAQLDPWRTELRWWD